MELDKVRKAFEHATPNVLDSVLSDCREQKGAVIMTEKKNHWGKKFVAVAAALAVVLGLGGGFGWYQYVNTPMAAVSLDVNPSIQITVNRNEKVLNADALNKDAQVVLEDMELEGSHINVALNAILGSMLRNHYLSVDSNTVLISVNAKDSAVGVSLQEKLTAEVGQILSTNDFAAAVMSQTVPEEEQIHTLAKQYNVSEGKVQLIQKLLAVDNHYTFESLSKLSVNELKLLSEKKSMQLANITSTGQASSTQYINEEAALNAALAHAKLTDKKIARSVVELDCDDGRMVYEVEFNLDGYEYEFEVDAITGKILKSDKEINDDKVEVSQPVTKPQSNITKEQAKAAALKHAGLTEAKVKELECELDDDRKDRYEVSFETAEYEYEYVVDAVSGKAVLVSREKQDDNVVSQPVTKPQSNITPEQAKAAALKHAGVTAAKVRELECELEKEGGKTYYEVTFETTDYEYEYTVDAVSGKAVLLGRERQDNDDGRKPTTATSPVTKPQSNITKEQAKAAALKHAGLTESKVKELECELDTDDGKTCYEVSFETVDYEYEYEVDAASGKAVLVSRERHDDD